MVKLTKEHRDKIVSEIYSLNRKVMKRNLIFYNIDNNTEYSFSDLMIHFFGYNITYYLQDLPKNNSKLFKKNRIIFYDVIKYLDSLVKNSLCPIESINDLYPIDDFIIITDLEGVVMFGFDKKDSHSLLNDNYIKQVYKNIAEENNRVKTIGFQVFKDIYTYYTYMYFNTDNLFQSHIDKSFAV